MGSDSVSLGSLVVAMRDARRLMETSCGDARSRGLLACVLEADGRVLCNGIKSVVQSVRLIDISDLRNCVFDPSWE